MKRNDKAAKEYVELFDRVGRACGDIMKRLEDEAAKTDDPDEKLFWSYSCGKVASMMDVAADLLSVMEGKEGFIKTMPNISISQPEEKKPANGVMDWLNIDLDN